MRSPMTSELISINYHSHPRGMSRRSHHMGAGLVHLNHISRKRLAAFFHPRILRVIGPRSAPLGAVRRSRVTPAPILIVVDTPETCSTEPQHGGGSSAPEP